MLGFLQADVSASKKAEDLLKSFVAFCQSHRDTDEVKFDTLFGIRTAVSNLDLDCRVHVEKLFQDEHGYHINSYLNWLDGKQHQNEEDDYAMCCKMAVFTILDNLHSGRFNEESEPYFIALASGGILEQAAKDAKFVFPTYRKRKVTGVLFPLIFTMYIYRCVYVIPPMFRMKYLFILLYNIIYIYRSTRMLYVYIYDIYSF